MPKAAKAHTDDGAIAFAKYYFERTSDIYQHPSTAGLNELATTLALSSCKGCTGPNKEITSMITDKSRYMSQALRVNKVTRNLDYDGMVVRANLTQFPAVRATASGTVVERARSLPSLDVLARLKWVGNGWRIEELEA